MIRRVHVCVPLERQINHGSMLTAHIQKHRRYSRAVARRLTSLTAGLPGLAILVDRFGIPRNIAVILIRGDTILTLGLHVLRFAGFSAIGELGMLLILGAVFLH